MDEAIDRVRHVAKTVAEPRAAETDRGAWPEATFRALQAEGVAGLVIPADKGGLGHGLTGVVRASRS